MNEAEPCGSGVCVCNKSVLKLITGVKWFTTVKTNPSLSNYKLLFINCYSFFWANGTIRRDTVPGNKEEKTEITKNI